MIDVPYLAMRALIYRLGLRGPYETEKWYSWDYLWGHVAWCLGVREIKFFWQRRTRGFDDSDLWSLDDTIVRFTLPRLKAFRNLRNGEGPMGFPAGLDERPDPIPVSELGLVAEEISHTDEQFAKWMEIIDKMIWSMEHWVEMGGMVGHEPHNYKEVPALRARWEEGMGLFHKYFHHLWD